MKNSIVKLWGIVLCIFVVGCTKELATEEIFFFDYALTSNAPLPQNRALDEATTFTFMLSETTGASTYTMKHMVTGGEGVLTYDGNVYEIGEVITISSGENTIVYTGSTEGTHKLTFSVSNSNRTPIQKEIVFQVAYSKSTEEQLPSNTCTMLHPLDGYTPVEIMTENESSSLCYLMDGNPNSFWNTNTIGTWLQFDLGLPVQVNQVQITFLNGDTRIYSFDLEVSDDGNTWETLLKDEVSSPNNTLQTFAFPSVEKRYIRYVGQGNSVNEDTHLTEFTIGTNTCIAPPTVLEGITPKEILVNGGFADLCQLSDNDLETIWMAKGDNVWIQYDFGKTENVNTIQIAFAEGDTKTYTFDIQTSKDGMEWEDVLTNEKSRPNETWQTFHNINRYRQYIRYVGHGNSVDERNALKEIKFSFNSTTTCDTPSPFEGIVPTQIEVSNRSYYSTCAIMDKDLRSVWSVNGRNEWILFDLGIAKEVNQMQIAFGSPNTRTYRFDLQVSDDAITWRTLLSNQNNSSLKGLQAFNFPTQEVRYLRYLGYGNNENDRNYIEEVLFTKTTPIADGTKCSNPSPNSGMVPTEIVASAFDSDFADTHPCAVMDNTMNTRWSAQGDRQWIYFDMGAKANFSTVEIAFFNGHLRTYTFDLQVSNDAVNWTTILTQETNMASSGIQRFTFPPQNTRYVRYLGFGNTINADNTKNPWNSITEFRIR